MNFVCSSTVEVFPFHGLTGLVGLDLLIVEFSRSHSDAPHSVGLLWTGDRHVAETTHNTHKRQDIYAPGGILTRHPSKGADTDPRLRARSHWNQLSLGMLTKKRVFCA